MQAPRVPPHEQYIAMGDSRRVWQSASARTGPTLDALEVEEGAVVGLRDDGSLIRATASVSGTPVHVVRPTPTARPCLTFAARSESGRRRRRGFAADDCDGAYAKQSARRYGPVGRVGTPPLRRACSSAGEKLREVL